MTHEFESGFFVKTPAWHRLGTVVQDAPTVEDAIKLAGLDWTVIERPLVVADDNENFIPASDHKALLRQTDRALLGVVGKDYRVFQNPEAFRFFDPFLSSGACQLDAAGSLRNGKRIWVLAKIRGGAAEVVRGDTVESFILLSNAHDGSQSIRVQFTTIRVVCMNTLTWAESRGDSQLDACLRVRHTATAPAALNAVQNAMDVANRTFSITVEVFERLAAKQVSVEGLREYVREVFEAPADSEKMPKAWAYIEESFETGPGAELPGVRGTLWGGYNAVTHWIDHAQGVGRGDAARLHSTWFGHGARLRNRAMNVAMQLLD